MKEKKREGREMKNFPGKKSCSGALVLLFLEMEAAAAAVEFIYSVWTNGEKKKVEENFFLSYLFILKDTDCR